MIKEKLNKENNPFNTSSKNFKPLILDGALGSYLQEKGFEPDNALWMTKINQSNSDVIIQIHKEYIEAGADIITANTFRTNPSAFGTFNNSECRSYVKQAVKLAREASVNKKIFIAGSNAPAEDCYQRFRTLSNQKLEMNHKYHIDLLMDSDVHFILNETHSHFDEIKIICDHCSGNKIPFVVSLYVEESLRLLSGEKMEDVLLVINDSHPLAVGFNCIYPNTIKKIWEQVNLKSNWGYYLNCGSGNHQDKIITCEINPDKYVETVKESLIYKPSFIGSCCGSNPKHTQKIKELLDGQNFS